ncbi:CsbD family protein [Sphingomonas sp. TX0543]|uniref:CsbD family protein n=1 Tax=unclassified Sphingomonas TaxID=196159 RepID=UPI0010F656AB|nr:CsbD family protein [Sphingomonas sp. 3P27F8]
MTKEAETRRQRVARERSATTRAAKGSVKEAIGTLIGDDAVRAEGRAEKRARSVAVSSGKTSARP